MSEFWVDIPKFEGLYEVSNEGRVRSLARKRYGKNNSICFVKERILKPSPKNRYALSGGAYAGNYSILKIMSWAFKT